MNILFLGDVVGSSGRQAVSTHLEALKKQYHIDLTIINGENAAHGKGITSRIYRQFMELGVDVITMGNHTFSKGELLDFIKDADRLVRPMNLAPMNVGQSVCIQEVCGLRIGIVNLCGQVFMDRIERSPFECMEEVLEKYDADVYFVDFHGETTSEKITFAYVFKDSCIGVVGTHTHVQTADERVIDGCGFISDVGMCGAYDSVLGRDKDEVIRLVAYRQPTRYTIAKGDPILCGIVIHVDENTRRTTHIERIQIRP